MKLSIREMMNGDISRLRYVNRYSTSRIQQRETVAEHSYYVALYCMLIGHWCEYEQQMNINMTLLLQRALVHDLEESRSGDFPRLFKHSSTTLEETLSTASEIAFKQVVEPLLGEKCSTYKGPPVSMSDKYVTLWSLAKTDDTEGLILKFADFLSVLGFMLQECDGGARRSVVRHVKDMDAYFEMFTVLQYHFLKPLVEESRGILEEIFHGSQLHD